jgi:hypothetical protein
MDDEKFIRWLIAICSVSVVITAIHIIYADIEHMMLGAEWQGSVSSRICLAQVKAVLAGYDLIRVKPPDKGVGCCFHVVPPSFPPRLAGKTS